MSASAGQALTMTRLGPYDPAHGACWQTDIEDADAPWDVAPRGWAFITGLRGGTSNSGNSSPSLLDGAVRVGWVLQGAQSPGGGSWDGPYAK